MDIVQTTNKKIVEFQGSSWWESEYAYGDRKLLMRMSAGSGHGAKIHVFHPNSDKVEFTLRFSFITPEQLLNRAKNKIDTIK